MSSIARVLVFTFFSALASASVVAAQEIDASVEGEVGSAAQEIQGRPNAANSSACASCSTTGARAEGSPLALFSGLVVLGIVARRRV